MSRAYALFPSYLWAVTVVIVGLIAWRRGGPYERMAAGVMFAGWSLTMFVYRSEFREMEWAMLLVDASALIGFVWIALRSNRYWPLFAAGFHLLAVLTHVARGLDAHLSAWAYLSGEIIWGYLLAAAIGYGAWTAADTSGQSPPPRSRGSLRRR